MCSSVSLWLWEALLGAASLPAVGNRWGSRGECALFLLCRGALWTFHLVLTAPLTSKQVMASGNPNPTATLNIALGAKVAPTFWVFSCCKSWDVLKGLGKSCEEPPCVLWHHSSSDAPRCCASCMSPTMLCSVRNGTKNNWHLRKDCPGYMLCLEVWPG